MNNVHVWIALRLRDYVFDHNANSVLLHGGETWVSMTENMDRPYPLFIQLGRGSREVHLNMRL